MKKIILIANYLYLGGITSYLITFSKYLCECGHEVTLLYHKADEKCLKQFCSQIQFVQLPEPNKFKVLFRIFFSKYCAMFIKACLRADKLEMTQIYSYFRAVIGCKVVEKYDIAISSEEFYCNAYVLFGVINAEKKVGWVHPDYRSIRPIKSIDYKVFSKLDKIVVVSESNKKTLQEAFLEMSSKFEYIENLLDEAKIIRASKEEINDWNNNFKGINIVTVCRLDNVSKRIDRIVNCCEYFKKYNLDFTWHVIGEGKDRESIMQLIERKDVRSQIILHGRKDNPYPYIAKADVFILTSQYEGKPISIEEAKILKCPVIVTNYNSAVEQIPESIGAIVKNNDETIAGEIFEILQSNSLNVWKRNLNKYRYNSEDTYETIQRLLN